MPRISLLDLPEQYRSLESASVLIVGNGPSAAGRALGKRIDDFDRVVRVNNYVTRGMESRVGSRTDIWVNGANQGLRKRGRLPENILVMIPPVVLERKRESIHGRIRHRLGTDRYHMLPLETMSEMEKGCGIPRPSTGFFAIYFFHLLGVDLTLHGFDFFAGSGGHYFDSPLTRWLKEKRIVRKAGKHDMSAERSFVEELIRTGRIKRLAS